ncbi:MAG: hypothetical protein GY863_20140 [bacterium]|nr:hypothetical protein [bacterium]
MCKHTRLVYIGDQEIMDNKTMPLYNCVDCYTTISKATIIKQKMTDDSMQQRIAVKSS